METKRYVRSHYKLDAWKKSVELVTEVYAITDRFPDREKFGLSAQMRRCAVSIPSNIAEGSARLNQREYLQFVGIARGSLSELETQMIIAGKLGFVDTVHTVFEQLDDVNRVVNGLITTIRKRVAQ